MFKLIGVAGTIGSCTRFLRSRCPNRRRIRVGSNLRSLVYQFLIRIRIAVFSDGLGHTKEDFGVDEGARRLDTVADLKLPYGLAQAHINSVRRNADLARDVLAGHVLIDEAQALPLSLGQQRHARVALAFRVLPCCHNRTQARESGKVKRCHARTSGILREISTQHRPRPHATQDTNPLYLPFAAVRQGLTRMIVAADCHNKAFINQFAASWQGLLESRLSRCPQAARIRSASESPRPARRRRRPCRKPGFSPYQSPATMVTYQ